VKVSEQGGFAHPTPASGCQKKELAELRILVAFIFLVTNILVLAILASIGNAGDDTTGTSPCCRQEKHLTKLPIVVVVLPVLVADVLFAAMLARGGNAENRASSAPARRRQEQQLSQPAVVVLVLVFVYIFNVYVGLAQFFGKSQSSDLSSASRSACDSKLGESTTFSVFQFVQI
jgi:nitrate/nitrite transporter NarK